MLVPQGNHCSRVKYVVDFSLECLFNSSSSDITLGCSSGEGLPRNDYNHVRGNYAFVDIASGMEVACFSNDFSLEFIVIHVDGWLNEHNRRRSARAHHDALGNHVTAHSTSVVFNGLGVASKTAL